MKIVAVVALQNLNTHPRSMYIIWVHARFSRPVNRVHDFKQAVPPNISVPFRSVHLASAVSDRYLDGSRVISIALKHSVHLASAVGTVLALNHCLENIPAGLTAPSRLYSYR